MVQRCPSHIRCSLLSKRIRCIESNPILGYNGYGLVPRYGGESYLIELTVDSTVILRTEIIILTTLDMVPRWYFGIHQSSWTLNNFQPCSRDKHEFLRPFKP
ncbi:hypothetical protein TNCV_2386361 [Trichonephila clavipes]|nr:hypothetical protein TNCV_2386361 [Trichonephila clavipes]